jgi:hypothetical protein
MPWVAAVVAVGALASAAIGAASSSADRAAASDAAKSAFDEIRATGAPPDLSRAILLKHFQSAGVLTPQMEQAVNQKSSELNGYQDNPQAKSAQMSALSMLQQRGQSGLAPEDRAAFNQVRNQVAQDAQAKQQQILQSFQARGQGGSGAELAAALQNASNAQNNASEQGDRLAGLSSQRALEAMVASGQLGGQMRSQDFAQAQAKAAAQDSINRFNAANAQAVGSANTKAKNNAQMYNLQNNQYLQNQNTAMDNNEALRQNAAVRQYWQDMLQYNTSQGNALLGKANYLNNQANQTAQQWQNIGSGLGQAGSAYMNYDAKKSAGGGGDDDYEDGGTLQGYGYVGGSPQDSYAAYNPSGSFSYDGSGYTT